jgi:hypothetical protein
MERNDSVTVNAHDALHVIGDVLHDPSVDKATLAAMVKIANDCYLDKFAGKLSKEEFCMFIGVLLAILCDNLQSGVKELQSGNGPAN